MKISQKISETLSIPTIKNVDAPFSTGQESWIILEYAGVDPALCFDLFLESKIKELYPSIPPPILSWNWTHTHRKRGVVDPLTPPPESAPESLELCGTTWGQILINRGWTNQLIDGHLTNLRVGSQWDPCAYIGWKIWGWVWAWHTHFKNGKKDGLSP